MRDIFLSKDKNENENKNKNYFGLGLVMDGRELDGACLLFISWLWGWCTVREMLPTCWYKIAGE